MTFVSDAEHTFDDGDTIDVGLDGRQPMLVFDGPNGLETVIEFDEVIVTERTIEFAQVTAESRHVSTGQLEGTPETYGDVGEWLRGYAQSERGRVVE